MTIHLGDVLEDARRRSFVGRRRELASFDEALQCRSPRRVLFVHGPGGIGKTSLLFEFRAGARAIGRTVVFLDGREVDPSPEGFHNAVSTALGDGQDIVSLGSGAVLLIDGYEQLDPIDGWLRGELIPALPADDVVVLAGRDEPAAAWRADPGWRDVVAIHRLGQLDDRECAELLARAGVEASVRSHLVMLGRGHPLAMALLADIAVTGTVPQTLVDVPDLVSELLESLVQGAPTDAHLTGLATCAKAWLTTEDLLRDTVGVDAGEVWAWLERRPFITRSPRGLSPHDLARDVLDAEFERRSPERSRSLHRIIHDHVVRGLRTSGGVDRQMQAQNLLYLHRKSPLTAAFFALRAQGSAAVVPGRSSEHDQVLSIIERFEGRTNAALAEGWLAEHVGELSVVRTTEGVASFAFRIAHPTGSALEDRDPVVRAVLDHVDREAPTRAGERVDIGRFFGGAREHQRDPYTVLAATVSSLIEWVIQPLAWSFVAVVDPEYWAPFFDYLAFAQLVEVEAGGLRHVVYGNDWRRFPVEAWLDLMNEREHSGGTGPPPASMLRPPPLDRARFAAAIKPALQDLRRPERLTGSPLMGTALAATSAGPTAERLRATIENAVDSLGNDPKGDRLRAVLQRTYVRASPTQEAAAEVLGLPFSTYRRYLSKAFEQLTALLWAVEIGELRPPTRSSTK